MAKLQFATLSNLQEFLNLHNVQIDSKISEAVKNSIKTVSQSEADTHFISTQKLLQ